MTNNTYLFSIFTPVFNADKYIRICLESVLSQTIKNFEWYIHDDGSTDSSYAICEEYAKKDKRIHLSRNSNGSTLREMNRFLDVALGNYIFFIDNDDYIEKDYLEKCLIMLTKTNADCAITSYSLVDSKSNMLDWFAPRLNNGELISGQQLKQRFLTSLDIEGFRWNKIYKSSVYKFSNLKFLDIFPADINFEFDLFDFIKSAVLVDTNGYYYRQTVGSEVNTLNLNKCIGMLRTFYEISKKSKAQGLIIESEYYRVWRYINSMFLYIHEKRLDRDSLIKLVSMFSWKKMVSRSVFNTLLLLSKYKNKRDGYLKFALKTIYVWLFVSKINLFIVK